MRPSSAILFVRRLLRRFIERRGYLLLPRPVPYGIEIWTDIHRLSQAWGTPVNVVFDVGANAGYTARAMLDEFQEARVVSFEPHPGTFAKLRQNIGAHPRFDAHCLALGDKGGVADLLAYENSLINSLVHDAPYTARFGDEAKTISVNVETLEQFCQRSGVQRIDVLKIDTEGFDLAVLKGGRAMLTAGKIRFVYTEFNFIHPRPESNGGSLAEVAALLEPLGYFFVASYTDYIVTEGEMFGVLNALFALPPEGQQRRAPGGGS